MDTNVSGQEVVSEGSFMPQEVLQEADLSSLGIGGGKAAETAEVATETESQETETKDEVKAEAETTEKTEGEESAETETEEEVKEEKLLAGEYKTLEELEGKHLEIKKQLEQREIDYKHSSSEGLRLREVEKTLTSQIEKLHEEKGLLSMKAELAPLEAELKMLELRSKAEDATETEKVKYELAKDKFDRKNEVLQEKIKAENDKIDSDNAQLERNIKSMENSKDYPHFKEVYSLGEKIAVKAGLAGIGPQAAEVAYLLAYGLIARQADLKSAQATKQGQEEVKKVASASAAKSQAPGARGKVTSPGSISGKVNPHGLSDSELSVLNAKRYR